MLVLKKAVKNIHKMKVDLTVEEKKCLEMVHDNLVSEAVRTTKTMKTMGPKKTIKEDANLQMVKEYLEDNLIDFKAICDEIQKLIAYSQRFILYELDM